MKRKGVYKRGDVAYIRYCDEYGNDIRESTGQRSLSVAETILAKRKTEVAMRRHFPVRRFNRVMFRELETYWWKHHGSSTRSGFEYLVPRIDRHFGAKKARDISPDDVQSFLVDLKNQGLAASSVNHHRTILNSIFSFAIRRRRFDENPVRAVPQLTEPPGRDRFPTVEEFARLHEWCEVNDPELDAFILVAGTTGLRKSNVLSRRWDEIHLDADIPFIYVPRTKNGRPQRVPIPDVVGEALKRLRSRGRHEYVFPARPNPRYQQVSEFKKPHRWDIRRRFMRACRQVGVNGLRVHDLRHMVATILTVRGIPDTVIRKLTGHRSRELERYQHLSEDLRKQTVEVIARELFERNGTNTGTPAENGQNDLEGGPTNVS